MSEPVNIFRYLGHPLSGLLMTFVVLNVERDLPKQNGLERKKGH